MIDFACKRFELNEVIKCGLGLSKADFAAMNLLLQNDEERFTADKISKYIKIDITTAQRSVKKLHDKGILIRTQENLTGGGYVFFYQLKDKKAVRAIIKGVVSGWAKKVEQELDKW